MRSAIALPELAAAEPDDIRPVVEIRLGAVRAAHAEGDEPAWALKRSGERSGGSALLTVARVARFLVQGGDTIVVEPLPGASERRVRLFLLGSALGILCFQRGLLPLHANAVVAGDGAYAFAGASGAGKSTLAGHFARAGYDVLCDDVCAVSFDAAGRPVVWPGLPRVKLWRDAAEALGHEPASLDRVAEDVDKYHVGLPAPRQNSPVPLRRVYLLERAAEGAAAIEVFRLERAWGYPAFDGELARLCAHIAA